MTPDNECSNCGATLAGRFCHTCGQDGQRGLLTLGGTLRGIFAELFEVESSLVGTVSKVFTAPGKKVAEYSRGRRRAQFSPTRLYLASAAIYFVVAPLLGDGRIRIESGRSFETASYLPLTWDSELILLALVPAWALALHVLLVGSTRRFEESFVFSVHFHVFYLAVLLVVGAAFAGIQALSIRGVAFSIAAVATLAPVPYIWIALGRAFQLRFLRRTVTTILLFIAQLGLGALLTELLAEA